MHWDCWTVPSAYIENQNEWGNIAAFFKKQDFLVTTTDKGAVEALEMVDKQSQVLIAVAYNDSYDITQQIHTICITKDMKGYVLHNAYRRDKNGKYIASAPYATLSEAVNNMLWHKPKLIYLIGIAS